MAEESPPPLEAERILTTLAEQGVDFVVIGGVAAQTHGRMRMTADIDLIPAPEPRNLARLAGALRSLEARILNPGSEDNEITATLLPRSTIWQFTTPVGGIDVMHEVPGGRPYEELRDDALSVQLGGQEVNIVSLDDLVAMKLARGWAIDLDDVAALTGSE